MIESIKEYLVGLWNDLVEFLQDMLLLVADAFLEALATLIALIPVPAFITQGLGSLLGAVPVDVIYFLSMTGFDTGLLLIGAGVAFRLTRKIVTLGIW